MKRYLPFLIASLTLALIGLLLAGLALIGSIPNSLFVAAYQFDFAGLVSRAGLTLGLIVLAAGAFRWMIERTSYKAREQEKKLQKEANKGFIRRLDHELKNPLTIIRLGIVNLAHSPNLTSKDSATLSRIGIQAEKLQKLIQDLRWLAELNAEGLEWSQVSLKEVLEEAITLATSLPGRDRQSIHLNFQRAPWPLGSVLGDREILILAFRNLLDNALKFSATDEHIEVRATDDGSKAIIEVADRGPGIPPDELPHIFEELFRGRQTKQIEGSGLGLALVRRIIELHGGEIHIRSQVSVGTAMIVHLPLASSGGRKSVQ